MHRKKHLMTFLTVVTGCFLFTSVLLGLSFCKSGCEDRSNCGDCELVPNVYCKQANCHRVGPIVINDQIGQCQTAAGGIFKQVLIKTWWDCSGDGNADCECWLWNVRLKNPPN